MASAHFSLGVGRGSRSRQLRKDVGVRNRLASALFSPGVTRGSRSRQESKNVGVRNRPARLMASARFTSPGVTLFAVATAMKEDTRPKR